MTISLTDIGLGTSANDGTGDTPRAGAIKINANNAAIIAYLKALANLDTVGTAQIDAGAVTMAKIASIANNTILGNVTGGAASPAALTAAQVKTMLAIASSDVSGLGTLATLNSAAIATNVSGLGTGVATALAVNVGTAGAPVINGGALGTPSSGTATNLTGLPIAGISATGTPSASNFLRGDGSWQSVSVSPGGSTTQVQYNSSGSFAGAAGFTFDGTSVLTLGVAGTSVGGLALKNATSGTITLQPVTGALGTVTLSLPATTTTLAGLGIAQTFTAAQTMNRLLTITQGTASEGIFASTGGSNTGSNATSAFDLSWTLNTTGSPDVFALRVTDTARGGSTKLVNVYAGASGTTSVFSLDRTGLGTFGSSIAFSGGSLSGTTLTFGSDAKFQGVSNIAYIDAGQINIRTFAGSNLCTLTPVGAATLQHGAADAASPVAQTISFQSVVAGTSNTAGVNATIQASRSTGSGTPGDILFKTAGKGAAATVQNTLITALTIKGGTTNNTDVGYPSVVQGSGAALNTTATDGFMHIASCAGAPTGVPNLTTGAVPMVFDTTNSKFCAYIGGAWKSVTLA